MNAETTPREPARQERSDLHLRPVLLGVAGVLATVLLVALLARLLVGTFGIARNEVDSDTANATRLESDPGPEIAAYRAAKRAELESYDWVDRDAGIAQVPIERAMQMLAEQSAKTEPAP